MHVNREYVLIRGPEHLECEMHINQEMEFIYVIQGSLTVLYDDGQAELMQGEAAMVLPYRLHRFFPSEDCRAFVLMFSYALAEQFYNTQRLGLKQNRKFAVSEMLDGYVQSMICGGGVETVYGVRSLYYAFLAAYTASCEAVVSGSDGGSVLRAVIDYITVHAFEKLSMSMICNRLCLSEAKVRRTLKTLNMSLADVIMNVRISHALGLLADADIPITEVAYECGFGSIRSFNRAFARVMQCAPSEYRKEVYKQS